MGLQGERKNSHSIPLERQH